MQDYSEMAKAYRPSHADATYDFKYGVRAVQVYFVVYIYIYINYRIVQLVDAHFLVYLDVFLT